MRREGVCFILRVFLWYFSKFSSDCQSAQRRTVSAAPIVTYFMFRENIFVFQRKLPPPQFSIIWIRSSENIQEGKNNNQKPKKLNQVYLTFRNGYGKSNLDQYLFSCSRAFECASFFRSHMYWSVSEWVSDSFNTMPQNLPEQFF